MSLTRRRLLGFASGAALVPAAAGPAWSASLGRRPPVIGLHQDRPYVDFTGEAEPFHGIGDAADAAAGSVADLSAEAFRRLNPFN